MKTCIHRFKWLVAFALLMSLFQLTPQLASAEGNKPLSQASGKDIISFGGKQWILLDPSKGYMILKDHEITREFDPMYTQLYDPTDSDNLAYYLNNNFYNSLTNKEWIEYKNWTIGNEKNESANSVSAKVGLISREELTLYQTQFGYIPVPSRSFWTRTPSSARSDLVYAASQLGAGSDVVGSYNDYFAVRPTIYLKSGLYVTPEGQITNIYGNISSKIVAPYPNQVFSEDNEKKFLTINGTTVADAGVTNTVKYTIDGLPAHTNQTIQTFVANGTNQVFRKDITVDHTYPKGTYTLRVWNEDGGGKKYQEVTTTFIIVSSNKDLSGISLSNGELSPGFDPAVSSYSASVANNVTSITVTPTVADGAATVEVNGASATSGQASVPISLNPGSNTITVRVKAQDGTQKNYTITVTRTAISNNNLSGLSLSSGTLSPAFDPAVTIYSTNVGNNVTSISVTPTVEDVTATLQVNGASLASGQASMPINLYVGNNTITVRVKAQDGNEKDYTITVRRVPNSNNNLSALSLSSGSLSPAFDPAVASYSASVANNVTSITVTPTVADKTAMVEVNGESAISGQVSAPIGMNVGENTITVRVRAQDGTQKSYTITVTRLVSSNNNLSALSLSNGTLNPGFDPVVTSYSATVANNVTSVTVTPTVADGASTLQVNGADITSGQASTPISLNTGSNSITVRVTAQDGTPKDYTISVKRQSGNADLSNLTVDGTSVAGFDPGTMTYIITVPNATTSVTVAGTAADADANVSVTGDGSLDVGDNTVTVRVTAEDTSVTKEYTISVKRQSGNANLSDLTVDGTSVVGFNSGTMTYIITVPNATTSVTVAGTAADADANVSVTGGESLDVGDNTVTVKVTAEDTTITKDYTIIVRRQSSNADLSILTVDGTSVAGFDSGTLTYNVNVPNSTTAVTVAGTAVNTNASVNVMGGTNLDVGDNTVTVRVTAEDTTITKDYTITIHRQSGNADLSGLTVDGTSVTDFDPATLTYTVSVPNATSSVTVVGTAEDSKANVSVTGGGSLDVGDNTVTVRVTAEDTTITKEYTITVVRAASSNSNLSALTLSTGKLSPAFDSDTTSYKASVGYSVTSLTVTPTTADATASVEVNQVGVTSGQVSSDIKLNVGNNTIDVTVTAQDSSRKSYTLQVSRQPNIPSFYPVTSVSLDETKLTLKAGGKTAALRAMITPSYATNQSVKWSSSVPEVASVAQNGVVTPHKEGETIITVTTVDGHFTAESIVKVEPEQKPEPEVKVEVLKASKSSLLLKPGKSSSIKVFAVYSDGKEKDITKDKKTSYQSSSDTGATVTKGVIKAGKKAGEVTITVSYEDQVLQIPVTISKVGLEELLIFSEQIEMEIGEDARPQVIAKWLDDSQNEVTNQVEWKSDTPEVVVIENGKLLAIEAGTATVTAYYGGKSVELLVKVKEPREIKRISVNKQAVKMTAEKTQAIKLTVYYRDGSKEVVTEKAAWSSTDESIATVEDGKITAIGKGVTTVTVKYRERKLNIRVTVTA